MPTLNLVVKSPSGQHKDVSLQAQTSWTVRLLKQHLSNLYPTKPVSTRTRACAVVACCLPMAARCVAA